MKIRNLIILGNTSIVPVQAIGLPIFPAIPPSINRNVHSNADAQGKLAIAQIISTNRDTIVFSKKQVKQIDEFYEIVENWENNYNSMSTEEVIGKLRGGDMKSLLKFGYEMIETIDETIGLETFFKIVFEGITNKKVDPTFFQAVKIVRFALTMKKVEAFVPLYPRLDALARGPKDFESFFEHLQNKEFDGLKNLKKRTGQVDRYVSEYNATLVVKQIQAKFKHTAKMGFEWNYNSKNAQKYMDFLVAHMKNPDTQIIPGIYRRVGKVTHFFNPKTMINLMIDENNRNFISAYILSSDQGDYLLDRGIL